jgi:aryl-alcohol dehydrogenase-like predicted oxidoreductase
MRYKKLGSSELSVSEVCLGTMTYGEQTSLEGAHKQIDYAIERGINFLDTAELYSVPPKPETQGSTEEVIGKWLVKNAARRADVIIATKISGPGLPWIREGSAISGESIKLAVDDSLRRLQTDYIDVYQLHWPNRTSPHFSKHWPDDVDNSVVDVAQTRAEKLEILQALDDCIKAGKIRHCGLSDDTPWGIKEYLNLAEKHNLPKMVSIQNEFNLLHLKDSPYVLETCMFDDVAYLPWSPIAGGALTGKYRNGARPEGTRWAMAQRNGIFRDTACTHQAIEAYYNLAQELNMSLTQMSLAYIYQFKGVTSTIIGASQFDQLVEDIDAYDIELTSDMVEAINAVIKQYPAPF